MNVRYEELTFPEVEHLDRDWPVIWPLGTGPLPDDLPGPDRILLPPLPFGFAAPLRVDSFERVLDSLRAILAEDGFHNQHLVECPGPLELPLTEVALICTGHTEQHGFHLPLSTDTVIAGALGQALGQRDDVTCLPVWPYGVSTHRRQFPGTLTVEPRAWEDFWVDIVGCLRALGFECVYLLNGHGGNHSFLVNVTKFAGDRWPEMFVATSFLHTSSGAAAELLERTRDSKLMGHACELETSYLLHLRPDLVHLDRAVDEIDFVATSRYQVDWISDGVLVANPAWTDDTRTGTYGAPSVSTAAKGQLWMEAALVELGLHLDEVKEQQRLRRHRRATGWVEGAWRQ